MGKIISKRFYIGLVTTFILLSLYSPHSSFALSSVYMTSNSSTYDLRTSYDWNETPWLYMDLRDSIFNVTGTSWIDPDNDTTIFNYGENSSNEVWISLSNWNTIKKAGDWNVFTYSAYVDGEYIIESAEFTVTPEPLSSILFLIGGFAFAARTYWQRRSNN